MTGYDLIIVGGGPAGAVLATLTAQAGHRVLILEKEEFPRYKVGESLLPATVRDLIDMLGIDREDLASKYVTKRGATFAWGAKNDSLWSLNFGGPRSDEAVLHPAVPSAYNVSRSTFDSVLIENAIKCGVEVRHGCSVNGFIEEEGRVTGVSFIDESGGLSTLSARIVADASGQRSKLASSIGKRTLSKFFSKLAVWSYFDNAERLPPPLSGNVLHETNKDSWVWFIPLDDKRTSVGVVTPAESYSKDFDPAEYLAEKISGCPRVRTLLKNSTPSQEQPYNETRICSDYSYSYSSFWKPGAFLLGDAACFVDVLLSSGVHLATFAAVMAAQSVNTILDGGLSEEAAMNEYEIRLRKEYAIFYDGLVGLYDMTREEDDYSDWLRTLLIDTSGIAYETEMLTVMPRLTCGEHKLLEQGRRNVQRMREHNLEQLSYSGEARMYVKELPELGFTLVPTEDMRSWSRVI